MLEEFYRVVFRKKIYPSITALQSDLDEWIAAYNEGAPTSGALVLRQDADANFA
ncbi:hypothetical protein ACVJGB_006406 [Bradyrhizobium liaoningense]